jgi:hypothetical protein
VQDQINRAWDLLGERLVLPSEPAECERYRSACDGHAQQVYQGRFDADESVPKKSREVVAHEEAIKRVLADFCNLAKDQGCYWGSDFIEGCRNEILIKFPAKKEPQERKATSSLNEPIIMV